MSRWVWSYGVWGIWLGAFLVLELLGEFGAAPWVTLSQTAWHLEDWFRLLYVLLCGFLIGLTIHIGMKIDLGRAVIAGMIIAIGLHFADKVLP